MGLADPHLLHLIRSVFAPAVMIVYPTFSSFLIIPSFLYFYRTSFTDRERSPIMMGPERFKFSTIGVLKRSMVGREEQLK